MKDNDKFIDNNKIIMKVRIILKPTNNSLKMHGLPLRRHVVNKKYGLIIDS